MDKKEQSKKEQSKKGKPNLMFEKKFAFDIWDQATIKKAFDFCEEYKGFLDAAKTERKAVVFAEAAAKKAGFLSIETIGESEKRGFNKPVYSINRGKAIVLARPGSKKISEGMRIALAHIDSPRLDLKIIPLFESEHIAFLKTHYYGGIKKYQWTALPLAMYGTIVKQDGLKIEISIGDKPQDPVFMITDLLPHLSKAQLERKMEEAVPGETLNVVVAGMGTRKKDDKNPVKKNLLALLNKEYGVTEEDFVSADLELVPQGFSRDLGFDRSMIAAYGQDDRVCAYGTLSALFESKSEYPLVVALLDKEEIGSEGVTGATSSFMADFISELIYLENGSHNENYLRDALTLSKAISADVTVAFDPDYTDVFDSGNTARIGAGVVIEKHCGHHGKYDTSEATAEYMAFIRKFLNQNKVNWQTGGMGKIDAGGGGTIAMFLAHYNVDVVDMGPALFSMHAPFEIASKADIYSAYLAYKAFFEAK